MSENASKYINIGLLAHVDAGKTTLSEAMLYLSGSIRKMGRVDNRDVFLDTYELERESGITIFSKQAVMHLENEMHVTLLDTPGHVDFSAEMERTLQVLDYAILVISGADGVQGHTETLWHLLSRYQIPTFLFINKMDQDGTNEDRLMEELQRRLSTGCVNFSAAGTDAEIRLSDGIFLENAAMCDESLLEMYLETGTLTADKLAASIQERKIFPCFFGSALKLTGVDTFVKGLSEYMMCPAYPVYFGAKVYKIARDEQGNRLTYLKVTGGKLAVKETISGSCACSKANRQTALEGSAAENAGSKWQEKINQIRIYSGAKYELANEAEAGMVCAVTGLTKTYPGEGLGIEEESALPVLEPVLNYRIGLPEECDVHGMLKNLRQLEEEEPLLHIVWNETLGEIHAQLMGAVQIEVLKRLMEERFGVCVEFDAGNIVYKETISNIVEGVGHFEPLRHYAEVHLLLAPGERGSGLQFFADCSEDVLDRNWQRLILTHLEEKEHKGVLIGAPITDINITLKAGRAHLKHTEGGDFRQATYRAVRQGLKQAQSILLEPYYEYRLEVPADMIGRAMSDIQRMSGEFELPVQEGGTAVLTGSIPVVNMRDYQTELISYTKGRGRLFCTLKGYFPCHNTEEIIEAVAYDSERDIENPTGSVFCAHGAGFVVKWNEVPEYMHLDSILKTDTEEKDVEEVSYTSRAVRRASVISSLTPEEEAELERMAEASRQRREQARKKYSYRKEFISDKSSVKNKSADTDTSYKKAKEKQKEYLLVDGYNIIFAWEELRELAEVNMDGARDRLIDILSNYQGVKKCSLILVFDAYKLEGFPGEVLQYHNIHVVYTKEAETADQYIEKVAHEIGRKYDVTVATSDGTEQVIIRGQGCRLLSAKELKTEVELAVKELREGYLGKAGSTKNYLFNYLDEETAEQMESVRLGKTE